MYSQRLLLYLGGLALLVALAGLQQCGAPSSAARAFVDPPPPELPANEASDEPGAAAEFERGMVLGVFPYGDQQPDYAADFRAMRGYAVNAVSLNFNWYMDDIRAPVAFAGVANTNNQTPSDAILGGAIDAAHAFGLRVTLFPSIYVLDLDDGEWRGRIKPRDGWTRWFESYRALVVRYARLAHAHHAEGLAIGVELITSERHTAQWRRIIREVRAVYSGALSYSANWDARNDNPWYAQLDVLGINAYFELSDAEDPTADDLAKGWARVRADLVGWRARSGVPFVITEMGYRSTEGSLRYPWDYFLDGDVDVAEQARGYEAFFRAWAEDPDLAGCYVYHWYGAGGLDDGGYSPRGKPAGDVLRTWYTRLAAR